MYQGNFLSEFFPGDKFLFKINQTLIAYSNTCLYLPGGFNRNAAFCLGQLLYFFQKAAALSGYLAGVNPFDQPGVDSYKKKMFRLLGKPGS